MLSASKNQMFEEAGRLRDRIKSINQIQKYQSVYIKEMRNIDIFAIKIINNKSCIHGKFYRNGSNYGNKSFFPTHEDTTEDVEILESFLYQFYANKDVPPKILVNVEEKFFKEVEITLNKKKFFLKTNETLFIPVRSIHRIENPYKKPVKIIEAQLGSILKETDIVRYQDIYGRIK